MTKTSLRPNQRAALQALLETGRVTDAASAAGVSRDSVHRWLREPEFQAALREQEGEILRGLSRHLIRLGASAVSVVEAVMADLDAPTSTRLRAADLTLSHLLRLRELVDLETRVADLESRLEGRNDGTA